MQDAYSEMRSHEEGIEKLIELEVAFINVRSHINIHTTIREACCLFRVTCHSQVPVTPDEIRTSNSRGRSVAIQVHIPFR